MPMKCATQCNSDEMLREYFHARNLMMKNRVTRSSLDMCNSNAQPNHSFRKTYPKSKVHKAANILQFILHISLSLNLPLLPCGVQGFLLVNPLDNW